MQSTEPNADSSSDNAYWREFDLAVCGFCAAQTRAAAHSDVLINTLVGEDLEWFGSQRILFMVHRLIENEMEKRILENKCIAHESSLDTEMSLNRSLRRQLTQLQRSSQDSEWNLQEQVASLTNQLETERAQIHRLHSQVTQLENQVNQQEHANNADNTSNYGDHSPATSISVATTPAWRGDRRSLGSATWSAGSSRHQQDKLLRVAERLNITSNPDDHSVI